MKSTSRLEKSVNEFRDQAKEFHSELGEFKNAYEKAFSEVHKSIGNISNNIEANNKINLKGRPLS